MCSILCCTVNRGTSSPVRRGCVCWGGALVFASSQISLYVCLSVYLILVNLCSISKALPWVRAYSNISAVFCVEFLGVLWNTTQDILPMQWKIRKFLAATKQLYDWFSPSVVCPSHLFDYVPIIVSPWNFQELLPMTEVTSMEKVKVRGQRSRSQRSTPNLAVCGP